MNPFLTKGYLSKKYFCDREKETAKIISAITNNRDLTLISPRRMGKTGLIHHVMNNKDLSKRVKPIYCDIYQAGNLSEMTTLLGNVVLQQTSSTTDSILKKIKSFFTGISPTLTINPLTMQTEIDFRFKGSEEAVYTLKQLFVLLNKAKKPIALALDEFQQIEKFPEKNVEAMLRTYIQQSNNVMMIYSGSSKHILASMFSDKNRPFYQSTQLLELDKISQGQYADFIETHFKENGKVITKQAIHYLLDQTRTHTYYVQYLCNRLYELEKNKLTEEDVLEKLNTILLENESYYYGFRNLLTSQQFALLRAIGKEQGVAQPTSHDFINKYKLGTTSTINSAIKSLTNKELVFKEDNQYKVYDVFFSLWLQLLN